MTTVAPTPSERHDVVAALDIGGTKTAAALVSRTGDVVARASAPTPGRAGATAVLETAAGLVLRLRSGPAAPSVRGLGVGSAGVVDPRTGRVLSATDALTGWAGTDLRARLAAATDLPTSVVNDVHAHALGEARYGAGRGHESLLFLAVGTGIGASFVLDGEVLVGAHAAFGHAGHQPSVYAGQLPCPCGRRGHLEAIASGPALAAEYGRRGGQEAEDLRVVAQRAGAGDPTAAAVIRLGGEAVGSALGGLVSVLDPHVVAVGGGVAGLGELWWDALTTTLRRDTLPSLADVPVLRASLAADAALVGAAALAWRAVA